MRIKVKNLNTRRIFNVNNKYILLNYVLIMLMMFAIVIAAESNIQTMTIESLESIQQQFTFADLIRITNNFERILGKGGFGNVYHGYINDTQVAVKVLSLSSAQGYQQFQAEASKHVSYLLSFHTNTYKDYNIKLMKVILLESQVKLLMRVHHRNLTTLVGYCYERTNMELVYEYMANGDLDAHLSGWSHNKSI